MNRLKLFLPIVALIFIFALHQQPANAEDITPVIRQLTNFDSDVLPGRRPVSQDGSLIAASSGENINGGNPDENGEIYLFHVPVLSIRNIDQITNTSNCFNFDPTISGDGNIIAFISDCDITGQNQNNLQQGFFFNRLSGQFTQFTNNTNGNVSIIVISKDGSTIAIRSTMNINGGNPDFSDEIFTFNINSGTLTQITMSNTDSTDPDINADGSVIIMRSRANFTGQNPTNRNQVFRYDGNFQQITNITTGTTTLPSVNDDGSIISYGSNGDVLLPNPGFIHRIYLYDNNTGTTTQITNNNTGSSNIPTLSGDGKRLLFKSNGDVLGPGNGFDQLFLYEMGVITQLTNFTGAEVDNIFQPSISCDGESFVFGGNVPDSRIQLFKGLFEVPVRPIPTLSEWGLVAMAGVLGIVGLLAIRRRKARI